MPLSSSNNQRKLVGHSEELLPVHILAKIIALHETQWLKFHFHSICFDFFVHHEVKRKLSIPIPYQIDDVTLFAAKNWTSHFFPASSIYFYI